MFELGAVKIEYASHIKNRTIFWTVIDTAADDTIQVRVGVNRVTQSREMVRAPDIVVPDIRDPVPG